MNAERDARFKISGAWGGWHAQLSRDYLQTNVLQGGYGGLEFNKTIFIGYAAYRLAGDAFAIAPTDAHLRADFRYHGPQVYYTPWARRVLHPKLGLQVGFGTLDVEGAPSDRFVLLAPSVGGELNLLRWLRLGVDGGYRLGLGTVAPGPGNSLISRAFGQATLKFGFSWGANLKAG